VDQYDLIIVGSGSGNAIPEYLSDWNIALVERGVFGGTCLNVGCIPSKMIILPADVAESARRSGHLGVHSTVDHVDWPAIRDRVFGRIDPIAEAGRQYRQTGTPNVDLITGTARFVGDKILDVGGQRITAPNILLAAGARPVVPEIDGLDMVEYHTSDTIMRLDELPARLAVIGGSFIAVELGHAFGALGSEVTVFNRSGRLLRFEDDEVAARFTEQFGARIDLRLNELPTKVEQRDGEIVLHTSGGELVVDELLIATGRTPNSDLLAATEGGLDVEDGGRIVVDDTMATNVDGVWAAGDVANRYHLKHLANREAAVAFWNMAHPDQPPKRMDYSALPHAVFSDPQVASVGLTQQQATAEGLDYVVGVRDYGGTAYGWAMNDTESFAKVIVDRRTELILGAHIVGPYSSMLLQPLVQAMQFGTTARQLASEVFYIHPALTEVVENALFDGISKLG